LRLKDGALDLNISPVLRDYIITPIVKINRYVKYKPPINPDPLTSTLIKNFFPDFDPKEYAYTAPTFKTGVASFCTYFRDRPAMCNQHIWDEADKLFNLRMIPFLDGSQILSELIVKKEINLRSSPGLPWTLKYSKKKDLIDAPLFWNYYYDWKNRLGTKDSTPALWTMSQKYEIRSSEKLNRDPPAIRTFTGSSMEHVIAFNTFCLDFNNKFYKAGANFQIPSFVGGTKFYRGFNTIWQNLSTNKSGMSCDAKNYDQSLAEWLLIKNLDFRLQCFSTITSNQSTQLCDLYMQTIRSHVVLEDGSIVYIDAGQNSGGGNTIVDNTLILIRGWYYVLLYVAEQCNQIITKLDIFTRIVLYTNGDDTIVSIPDDILLWLTPERVIDAWQTIGVEMKIPGGVQLVEDLDFCSQTVVKYAGLYLPLMDKNKLISNLLFNPKVNHPLYTLLKAHAIRIESWSDVKLRPLLKNFINFWRNNHVLQGTSFIVDDTVITYDEVMSTYLPDDVLLYLYTGNESGSALIDISQIKNSFILLEKLKFNF